jgi:hypothetical protein
MPTPDLNDVTEAADAAYWQTRCKTAEDESARLRETLRQRKPVPTARLITSGGVNDHPCPSTPAWFASYNEENYQIGPCDTEDDARSEAQDAADDDDTPYAVALCTPNHIDLSKWFDADRWLNDLIDVMDDDNGANEDGDNHPLEEITAALTADLQASIRSAIWHWQNRKGLKLKAYWFKDCRTVGEPVMPTPQPEGEPK